MEHITVLQQEAVTALALNPASVVVDATVGAGGHAQAILSQLGSAGTYIGFDADESAIKNAQTQLSGSATIHLIHQNFRELGPVLDSLEITAVDAVLADLGWHTDQFTSGGRGFSFTDEAALTMTYGDPSEYAFTAADIVNEWDEPDIANVLFGYGEEHYSRRIAKAIVDYRRHHAIRSGQQLADIIKEAVPAGYRKGRTHPATKSFQALRIAVNDEFTVLETFIATAFDRLSHGGRLAIISFHSLEDRIVKLAFRSFVHDHVGVLVTKKPITPTPDELHSNPRARSAKLRTIEKL